MDLNPVGKSSQQTNGRYGSYVGHLIFHHLCGEQDGLYKVRGRSRNGHGRAYVSKDNGSVRKECLVGIMF